LDALVVALFAAGILLYIGNIKKSLAFSEQGQFFSGVGREGKRQAVNFQIDLHNCLKWR
jgi:hypothetical protein